MGIKIKTLEIKQIIHKLSKSKINKVVLVAVISNWLTIKAPNMDPINPPEFPMEVITAYMVPNSNYFTFHVFRTNSTRVDQQRNLRYFCYRYYYQVISYYEHFVRDSHGHVLSGYQDQLSQSAEYC
jgi:hypothetical protein